MRPDFSVKSTIAVSHCSVPVVDGQWVYRHWDISKAGPGPPRGGVAADIPLSVFIAMASWRAVLTARARKRREVQDLGGLAGWL